MIDMPDSYDTLCRRKGILSSTNYNLPEKPDRRSSWFEESNIITHTDQRGIFYLLYVLRSFPRPTDDRRYNLLFVTKQGIFYSVNSHSCLEVPLDFETITAKRLCDWGDGNFITLKPNTRQIIILKHYRYTELLDNRGVPNTFYWYNHPELFDTIKNHEILLESETTDPIRIPFREHMYEYLKRNAPYLYLRSDNYVKMEDVRFVRQPF